MFSLIFHKTILLIESKGIEITLWTTFGYVRTWLKKLRMEIKTNIMNVALWMPTGNLSNYNDYTLIDKPLHVN